jgi:hypothetical protein
MRLRPEVRVGSVHDDLLERRDAVLRSVRDAVEQPGPLRIVRTRVCRGRGVHERRLPAHLPRRRDGLLGGACGAPCPSGELCSAGMCVSQCPTGETECSGGCVNLMTDANNCATCGHSCGTNGTCVNGTCACAPGMAMCNGTCVDQMTDASACGPNCDNCSALVGSNFVASATCSSGTCNVTCDPNWVNCSGNPLDGCPCFGTKPSACNGTMCVQT